jgi:hypothetical protein
MRTPVVYLALAVLALATVGCSYHTETVVQKPRPDTAMVVVPDSPPPATTTTVISTP